MRPTTIPDDVREILKASRIEGQVLFLPAVQLERKLYERTSKVIEALGGKWNRGLRGHLFKVLPPELVAAAAEAGEFIDRKKALQFFETPAPIGARMVERLQIKATDTILEPSAGHGALIREVKDHFGGYVTAIEIDEENCKALRTRVAIEVKIICADFLEWARCRPPSFDVALMNPPFTNNQDVTHIRTAWELLRPGGRLAAICAEGAFFRSDRHATVFREFLDDIDALDEQLDPGTFRESGTDVRTRIIWATKGES